MKLNLNRNANIFYYINLIIATVLVLSIYCMKMDKISIYINILIICITILITGVMVIKYKNISISRLEVWWIISIVGLVLSCMNSVDKNTSIKFTIFYFFAIYISIYIAKNIKMMDVIVKLIKIFTVLFAIFTILPLIFKEQYLKILSYFFTSESLIKIEGFLLGNRYPGLGGFLGNNGFLLSCGLGVYLIGVLTKEYKLNIFYSVKLIIIMIAILLTGSRTLALTTIISIILCVFLKEKNTVLKLLKKSTMIICAMVTIGIIIWIIYPKAIEELIFRFKNGDESVNSRLLLYSYAIMLFKNRFMLGYGINTFLGLTYINPYMKENTYVHNTVLQLLAETGIVGTFIGLIPYIMTWIITIKFIRCEINNKYKRYLLISLFIQNIFLLYFITGNPIYDYNILLMYFIFISITLYVKWSKKAHTNL